MRTNCLTRQVTAVKKVEKRVKGFFPYKAYKGISKSTLYVSLPLNKNYLKLYKFPRK